MSIQFMCDRASNKAGFAALDREQSLYQVGRMLIKEHLQVMQHIFENVMRVLREHVEQSILADRKHQYALQAQKQIEL